MGTSVPQKAIREENEEGGSQLSEHSSSGGGCHVVGTDEWRWYPDDKARHDEAKDGVEIPPRRWYAESREFGGKFGTAEFLCDRRYRVNGFCGVSTLTGLDTWTQTPVTVRYEHRLFDDLASSKMIRDEIRILRCLAGHPSFIQLVDFYLEPRKDFNAAFVVKEFISLNLGEMLQRSTFHMCNDEICKILFQVFCALTYMHSAGLWHGHLFPHHIHITSKYEVKINFKQKYIQVDMLRERIRNSVKKQLYGAPEILLTDGPLDGMVDMWAVGCLMAELHSGMPLFYKGWAFREVASKQLYVVGVPPPEELLFIEDAKTRRLVEKNREKWNDSKLAVKLPDMPPEGMDLITKLLKYSPQKRIRARDAIRHPYIQKAKDASWDRFNFDVCPKQHRHRMQTNRKEESESKIRRQFVAEARFHSIKLKQRVFRTEQALQRDLPPSLRTNFSIGVLDAIFLLPEASTTVSVSIEETEENELSTSSRRSIEPPQSLSLPALAEEE